MTKSLRVCLVAVWLALIGQSAANDALCLGQEYNRFVSDPQSCDGYFLCRNDRSIFGRCDPGFMFDEPTQFCRFPEFVDCDPNAITTTTEIPTTTPAGPIELWICIGIRHDSFRNDPRRCGSYFFCWNNIGHGNSCPRNSWYHPLLNICTNPGNFCTSPLPCDNGWPGNCIETTTSSTTTTTTMTTPTTTEITTTTPSGPIELWVCIGRPDDSFTNHPYRCGAYFVCRQLIGRFALCPPRTWFHPPTQTCRSPGSFCVPREPCDNGSDQNGNFCVEQTTTVAPTTTTTVATTTPSGPLEIWICIGIRHNTFTRHPRRCGAFFLCRSNLGTEGSCPRGFWFHPTLHICTSPGHWCRPTEECDNGVGSNCRDSGESNSGSSSSSDSHESGNGGSSGGNSGSGECNGNGNGSGECGGGGGGEVTSAPEHSTTTPGEKGVCEGKDNLEVTANPYECGTFYLCMANIGLPVQCPWEQWFNPQTRACEAPGTFCTPTGPCDNGIGNNCATTEDPIITPTHSTDSAF